MKSKSYNRIKKFLIIFVILMIPFAVVLHISRYNTIVYPIDRAMAKITRAESVNDLKEIANYIEEALDILGDKSGNPCWFYPDDTTNWNNIIKGYKTVMKNCKIAENSSNIGSDAYQEAVDTACEKLEELKDQTFNTKNWDYWTIEFYIICIIWNIIFWITLFIIFPIIGSIVEDKKNKEEEEAWKKRIEEENKPKKVYEKKKEQEKEYVIYQYRKNNFLSDILIEEKSINPVSLIRKNHGFNVNILFIDVVKSNESKEKVLETWKNKKNEKSRGLISF